MNELKVKISRLIFLIPFRFFKSELEGLNSRLDKCVLDCSESINKKKIPDPTLSQNAKYAEDYERCAGKCADKTINSIPKLFKTIKKVLEKGPIE